MTATFGLHGLSWVVRETARASTNTAVILVHIHRCDCIGLDRDRNRAEGEYPWRCYCRAHWVVLLVALAANR